MKSTSNPLPRALPCRALIVSEPGVDGVFRYVEALVRYLLTREIEVDFAYSDVRSGPDLYALVKFVASHRGKTLNLRTGNRPILADARALLRLWRLVRERRPGIIHAHSSKAGALVRFLPLVGVRCPIFYTPHAYYGMDTHLKAARLFNMVEALLAPIGTTINLSKSEAAYAREKLGLLSERQSIRHSGVDCRAFCPPARDESMRIRRTLGIPEEVLLLGTVARYSSQKDPVTLHTAVRDVLARHENLWFIHVGKGELWDTVNRLGPAVPRLLRVLSFSPMSDFYKALNGFVLASRYEGFSLAVLEAVATGLPIILSRACGNRDFGSFGLNSLFWTIPGDFADLTRAIEAWTNSAHIATNHREVALNQFQQSECLERLVQDYQESLRTMRKAKGRKLAFGR